MDSAPPLNLSKSAKLANCISTRKVTSTALNKKSNVKTSKKSSDTVTPETAAMVCNEGTNNNSNSNCNVVFSDSDKISLNATSEITITKEKEEPCNDSITHIVSILDAAQAFPEPACDPTVEETAPSLLETVSVSNNATPLAEGKQPSSSSEGEYKCDKCDQAFVRASQLRTHVKVEHSSNKGEGSHHCDQCDAKFSRASQLLQHRQTHKPSDGSICVHCNEPMYTYEDYRAHHKMHNKTYQCHECGVTFLQKVYLTVHARVHSGEKPFKCNTCPAAFKQLSHLTTHKRTHTHEQPFICASCPARFSQSSSLKRHYRTHTGEKPYVCTVCSSAFSDKRNLTRHMMCHKGIKPYECTHCPAKFSQKIDLHRHNLSHLGVKPFKCSICGVSFSRKNNLLWHERTHDQKTSQQTCAACGIGFSNVRDLKRHYREHNVTKNLSCKLCGIAVSCRFSLLRHMKTHTNNRPFVCSACPAAFMQLSTLKKHEMRHKGEKNFKCNVCGKAFFDARCLKRHRVTIHGEERFVKREPEDKPVTFSSTYDHKPVPSQTKNSTAPLNRGQVPAKSEVVLSSGMASNARSIVVEATDTGPQFEAVMALSDTGTGDTQTLVLSQPGEPPKTYRLAGNCQNHQNHFITFLDGSQWQAWCICNPQNIPADHMESKHSIVNAGSDSVTPVAIFHGGPPSSQQSGMPEVAGQEGVMAVSNASFSNTSPSFDSEPHFSYTTDRFSSHMMEPEANSVYTFTPDGDSYLVQPVCEDPGCDLSNSTLPSFHPDDIDGASYDESMEDLNQDVKNDNVLKGDLQNKQLQSSSDYNLTVNNPTTGSIKITSKTFDANVTGDVTLTEKNKSAKGNQRKKYQCTVCFKWFLRKVHLSIHMRRHTKEKPYKCTICFALFTHNNTLVAHMRSHTGERPFRCEICEAGFAQKSNLTAHMRIHTGEKPYRCDVCNMGFRQASHLPTHRRTHSNERPFACSLCTKRFTQNSALKRHLKTHQRSKRNDLACPKCHKKFQSKAELQNHASVHENASNDALDYTCSIENCGEKFTNEKLLDAHMSLRHVKNGTEPIDPNNVSAGDALKLSPPDVKYAVSSKSNSGKRKEVSASDVPSKKKKKSRGVPAKGTSKHNAGTKAVVAPSRSSQRIKFASISPKERHSEFITGDFINLTSPENPEHSLQYSADACKTEVITSVGADDHGQNTSGMGDWCFCEVPHSANEPHSSSYRPLASAQVVQPQQQPTFAPTNNISVGKNIFSLDQGGSGSEFYAFVDEKGNVMKASVAQILNTSSSSSTNVGEIVATNSAPNIQAQQNVLSNIQIGKPKNMNTSFQPAQSIELARPSEQNFLIAEDVTHVQNNIATHGSTPEKSNNVPENRMEFAASISLNENMVSSTITDSHRLLEMTPLVPSGGVVQLMDDSRVQIVGTMGTDGKMQLFDESNIQVVNANMVNAGPASVPVSLPPNNHVLSTSDDLNSFNRVQMYDCNPVQIVNNAGGADALNNLTVGGGENGGLQMLTLVSERQDSVQQTPCSSSAVYLNTAVIMETRSGSSLSDVQQEMAPSVNVSPVRRPPSDKDLSTKGYSCPICSAVQSQWRAFIAHVKDAHPDQHMCSVCYKVFDSAGDLKFHFNEKHSLGTGAAAAGRGGAVGNDSSKLYCFECNVQFREEVQLAKHLSDVHKGSQVTGSTAARRRKVPSRGKGAKRSDGAVSNDRLSEAVVFIPEGIEGINSQIVNMPDNCQPNSCGIMNSTTVQESVHSNSTSGGICIINSTTSADLNVSQSISNCFPAGESSIVGVSSTGKNVQFDPLFETLAGTATTNTPASSGSPDKGASDRARIHSPISPSKRRRKADKHSCSFCGEKFASQCDLERHTLQHTGEKPYVCGICSASFTRKSSLNNHERIHSGMKPYVCSICSESFSYRYQFNKHKTSVH